MVAPKLKILSFALLLGLFAADADARRWQNLEVGHREFQTAGAEGITVVYSVTADIVGKDVVFDLDIDHQTARVSRSVADVRVTKAELPRFEAVLKTFDQWRDQARSDAASGFEKSLGQVAGIEWWFHWTGRRAKLRSGAGRSRHPLELAEQDVTVFRVLLVSAPDMEREINAFQRRNTAN